METVKDYEANWLGSEYWGKGRMGELERVEGGETGWIGLHERRTYCHKKYQTKFLKRAQS